eukprot:TRINITY_DN48947_c0_g1_i1.p2 TRINITY_DN48947_c0_g1~~TRINITY_DN48947_c0_g1_i1.p2  ORF type:complete len:121 (-),score=5.92 TRINITY_DN48947_c0_g1_i1:687-1049(-)
MFYHLTGEMTRYRNSSSRKRKRITVEGLDDMDLLELLILMDVKLSVSHNSRFRASVSGYLLGHRSNKVKTPCTIIRHLLLPSSKILYVGIAWTLRRISCTVKSITSAFPSGLDWRMLAVA